MFEFLALARSSHSGKPIPVLRTSWDGTLTDGAAGALRPGPHKIHLDAVPVPVLPRKILEMYTP